MIIHLNKSSLFTIHPCNRFSRRYDVEPSLWTEIWKRYKLLGYTVQDAREFFEFKSNKRMTNRAMKRWLLRSEIYSMSNPMVKKGVRVVMSSFFNSLEEDVINELTKNIKNTIKKDPKVLL